MTLGRKILAWGVALVPMVLAGCGVVPSNPATPPEILVAAQSGTPGASAAPYAIPMAGSPSPLTRLALPAGVSIEGGVVASNMLIYAARQNATGTGEFLVAALPLSAVAPVYAVGGLSGTPLAISMVAGQFVAVLETTVSAPQGCLELFRVTSLIAMTGGTATPYQSCMPLPGSISLVNGFLLPIPTGVAILVGRTTDAGGYSTQVAIYSQETIASGSASTPLVAFRPLSAPYPSSGPIAGAALSSGTFVLLPDPGTLPSVDLYTVTSLTNGGTGSLSPFSVTRLGISAAPSILAIDPADNFLMAATTGGVSLFGLESVLNPPGTLGTLGSIEATAGEEFRALVTYTGSS